MIKVKPIRYSNSFIAHLCDIVASDIEEIRVGSQHWIDLETADGGHVVIGRCYEINHITVGIYIGGGVKEAFK